MCLCFSPNDSPALPCTCLDNDYPAWHGHLIHHLTYLPILQHSESAYPELTTWLTNNYLAEIMNCLKQWPAWHTMIWLAWLTDDNDLPGAHWSGPDKQQPVWNNKPLICTCLSDGVKDAISLLTPIQSSSLNGNLSRCRLVLYSTSMLLTPLTQPGSCKAHHCSGRGVFQTGRGVPGRSLSISMASQAHHCSGRWL